MIYKRLRNMARLLMAVLFMFLAFPVSASMVSFLLVETGINVSGSSGRYSNVWEGALMEAFFEAGFIVTNSPIAQMEKKPDRDLSGIVEEDFNDAILGGADYYILGFLEYQSQGTVPTGITLKLYNSNSRELIHEERFPAGTGRNLDEEGRLAQNAGRAIISRLAGR